MSSSPETDRSARGRPAPTAPGPLARGLLPIAALLASAAIAPAEALEPDADPEQIERTAEPGDPFTLRLSVTPDAPVVLLVSLASDLSAVVAIPAVADAAGAVELSGDLDPTMLPAQALAIGLRFTVATLDPSDGSVLVSDPVPLPMPLPPAENAAPQAPPGETTGTKDLGSARAPSEGSAGGDEAVSAPSGPTVGMLPPALQTSATVSTLGGLSSAPIVFRRLPNHRFVVSHDQPVPIQGSGH